MNKTLVVLTAVLTFGVAGFLHAEGMEPAAVKAETMAKDTSVKADVMVKEAVTTTETMTKDAAMTAESAGKDAMEKMEKVEVNNKICPIEGGPIKEDEAVKIEYKGKIYNLCCPLCVKKFNEDPEKAISSLPKEGAEDTAVAADAAKGEMKEMKMDAENKMDKMEKMDKMDVMEKK